VTRRPRRSHRNTWEELAGLLAGVAGCVVFYVAIGGALGFAVTRPWAPEGSCAPYHEAYGLLGAHCRIAAVNMFWFATLALPRFLIAFPALAVATVKAAANGVETWRDVAIWLLYSIPIGLVLWVGVRYWLSFRAPRVRLTVWLAVAMIAAEILLLGLRE